MNYQKIYNDIIEKAKLENRQKGNGIYYENHHIQPRCLNGGDDEDNLILLTTKEHFVCHKLLTRIYPNNRGILTAFHFMVYGQQGQSMNLGARVYEEARELFIKAQTGRKVSIETKKKMSKSRKGKKHTEGAKEKMRKAAIGRQITEETRKILSESHRGLEPGNKGKKMGPRPEEVKKRISEKLKGRKLSEESLQQGVKTRRKNGYYDSEKTSMFGKKHSSETLEKMRQAKLGKSSPNKGRKYYIDENGNKKLQKL